MKTISKLTSKHKYYTTVQNCFILSELKWELLDVLKCQNIRFIIFFQLVLCQVGSANFLFFLWTFQCLQMPFKTIILKILLPKCRIKKHLFSFQLEPVALFQIRSEAEEQVCHNVWRISVSLHDISHEIVITTTTVSAPPPTSVSLSYINNFLTFKQKLYQL